MIQFQNISDEKIIEKIKSEDQEFYALIMERYQNKLLRYAFNLTNDKNKATDVVQESFIKAFINLKNFDIKKKFSSWIYRIVHNESMNVIKKYQKEIFLPPDIDFKSDENIEEDFDKKKIIEDIGKCLKKLPVSYSEPLVLFYIEDKSYEEISDILKMPMGTVATRIS